MTCYVLFCFVSYFYIPYMSPEHTPHLQQKSNSRQNKNQTTTGPSWTSVSHNQYFVHWNVIQAVGTEDQNMVEPVRILPKLSYGTWDQQNQEQRNQAFLARPCSHSCFHLPLAALGSISVILCPHTQPELHPH